MLTNSRIFGIFLWLTAANAHIAAWHQAMYCLNGNKKGVNDTNTNAAVQPMYMLEKDSWWMHHSNQCDEFPPPPGDFLILPAGGNFTVEMAVNRHFTTCDPHGQLSDWPDGGHYPDDYNVPTCIVNPNIHVTNYSMAAGTAFAIAYKSNIKEVTPKNLVVFSVAPNTPFKRLATFEVPVDMPPCPPEGCICAWGWVPNGCGEPNMYQLPYRCNVTGSTSTNAVGEGQPPVWCEDDPSKCVRGPKQMIYWNQLSGNNVNVTGFDRSGHPKSPGYNPNMGFHGGAQNDIFIGPSDKVNRATPTKTNDGKNRLANKTTAHPAQTPKVSAEDVACHKRALSLSARLGKRYW